MVPENLMQIFNIFFLICLLNYTLWHLLESPHRGRCNGIHHVKIFLSQNTVLNVVYRTTLSVRADRTDKTVKILIRLLLKDQSDQGLHFFWRSLISVFTVCHSICFIYTSNCKENSNCSILRYFQYLFQVFQFLEVST